jgi:hypothetical protein
VRSTTLFEVHVRADDDDRARGVVRDLLADRTEQQPPEAAAAPVAHDEHVGTVGRGDQRVGRPALEKLLLDVDTRDVDLLPDGRDDVVLHLAHLVDEVDGIEGDVPEVRCCGDVGRQVGGDDLDHARAQPRFIDGPAQRRTRSRRTVDTDHDAMSAVAAHRPNPPGHMVRGTVDACVRRARIPLASVRRPR